MSLSKLTCDPESKENIMIKICGLKTKDEIKWTAGAGADLGGIVVFYPKSRRNMEIPEAADLVKCASSLGIKMVAVTVSPDQEAVSEIVKAGFDYIQIHGNLDEEILKNVKIPVIKAFNVRDLGEYEKYKDNEHVAGYVFDAAVPGSGIMFDHNMLSGIGFEDLTGKFMLLAGGLNPDNVRAALENSGIPGADTSSGVENTDGTGKNRDKIYGFVSEARKALENMNKR